jgi:uncharacterized protein
MDLWFFTILAFAVYFFLSWSFRNDVGRRSFDGSPVRENFLPLWAPFFLFGVWVLTMVVFSKAIMLIAGMSDGDDPVVNQAALAASSVVTSLLALLIASAFFKDGLGGFGLDTKTLTRDLCRAAGVLVRVWPAVVATMIFISYIVPLITDGRIKVPSHPMIDYANTSNTVLALIFVGIIVTFIAPVLEEILFRGFVQTKLSENLQSRWGAIFMTSAFFAVIHGGTLWLHWPALFIFSCALGYVYEKSGSLFQSIFLHGLFNGANLVMSVISSQCC